MTKTKKNIVNNKKVDIKDKAELLKEIDSIFSSANGSNNNSKNADNKKRIIDEGNKDRSKKQKTVDDEDDVEERNEDDDDEEEDEDGDDDGGMEYFHDDNTHGLIVSNKSTADGPDGTLFKGISPHAPLHRVDRATGLPVYKAALLKAGEGGGTKYCPFDCNCCF